MTQALKKSSPKKEGRLEVSRWVSIPVLLDPSEMRDLLSTLAMPKLLHVGGIVSEGSWEIGLEPFSTFYSSYIQGLISGNQREEKDLHYYFSGAMTSSLATHYAMEVKQDRYLLKGLIPYIQMQHHHFVQGADGRLLSMAHGQESFSWGVLFSYPQIYRDPKTKAIHHTFKEEGCVNNALFHNLRKWMRNHTRPTTFILDGRKKTFPMRLGVKAKDWIGQYQMLQKLSIEVVL